MGTSTRPRSIHSKLASGTRAQIDMLHSCARAAPSLWELKLIYAGMDVDLCSALRMKAVAMTTNVPGQEAEGGRVNEGDQRWT